MCAIGNGMHAYGGVIPYVSTFLVFLSYCIASARLAALSMHQVCIGDVCVCVCVCVCILVYGGVYIYIYMCMYEMYWMYLFIFLPF